MPERQSPYIPDHLLQRAEFIQACTDRDLGGIFRLAVKWAGFSRSLISRQCGMNITRVSNYINGKSKARSLDVIERVSEGLHIPGSMLGIGHQIWEVDAGDQTDHARPETASSRVETITNEPNPGEFDEMNRRELLRSLATIGPLVALPPSLNGMQVIRAADPIDLEEHQEMNGYLWRVYAMSTSKRAVYPVVRQQLAALRAKLERPHNTAAHNHLCMLISDLLQLAGEISFDGNHYTEAAHCYALAVSASKEANAYDLWACALNRQAFISMHERRFPQTASVLAAAAHVAQLGDAQLSTRQWVAILQAQTYAELGDLEACNRALDIAATVHQLPDEAHNGGWLRFNGSRLAEESGSCYVQLGRHDLAHAELTNALSQKISLRRRGSVLTDLALLGVQQRDIEQVTQYGREALELVEHTDSGYVERKLRGLQAKLSPLLSDHRVAELYDRITIATQPA